MRKGEDSLGLSILALLDKVFFCSLLPLEALRTGAKLPEPDGKDREENGSGYPAGRDEDLH